LINQPLNKRGLRQVTVRIDQDESARDRCANHLSRCALLGLEPRMAGYRHSNPDRAKAAVAALIVHVAIGAAFLTGLVINVSQHPSEVIQTFDVTEPPPPPVVEIEESAPKGDPGEAGKKADPTPIVAPEPRIEVPTKPPVAAAPVPGQGAAPSAGAAQAGAGTGDQAAGLAAAALGGSGQASPRRGESPRSPIGNIGGSWRPAECGAEAWPSPSRSTPMAVRRIAECRVRAAIRAPIPSCVS
jgi:hypothetical protein